MTDRRDLLSLLHGNTFLTGIPVLNPHQVIDMNPTNEHEHEQEDEHHEHEQSEEQSEEHPEASEEHDEEEPKKEPTDPRDKLLNRYWGQMGAVHVFAADKEKKKELEEAQEKDRISIQKHNERKRKELAEFSVEAPVGGKVLHKSTEPTREELARIHEMRIRKIQERTKNIPKAREREREEQKKKELAEIAEKRKKAREQTQHIEINQRLQEEKERNDRQSLEAMKIREARLARLNPANAPTVIDGISIPANKMKTFTRVTSTLNTFGITAQVQRIMDMIELGAEEMNDSEIMELYFSLE